MKELIQEVGVRKWFGDEWITLQTELMAVLEGHFGHNNKAFILSGCVVSGSTVSSGIVCLMSGGIYKLCRFAGATGVTFPVYFTVEMVEETRLYIDGEVKSVAVSYNAVLTATDTGGLLEMKANNTTPRFADALQDEAHRFVTDIEKNNYSSQAALAISVLRDGIASNLNTLEKLRIYLEGIIPNDININDIYTYIDSLSYFPVYRGASALTSNVINWKNSTPERFRALDANVQLSATNLIAGKTIGLKISGNFQLTFSPMFKKANGSPIYSPAATNYIQMKCLNDTPGNEYILYAITLIP